MNFNVDIINKTVIDGLVISNLIELENANELAKYCNDQIKDKKNEFKSIKEEAAKKHKAIVAAEKEELKPFEEAKKIIANAIKAYMLAEEHKKKELEMQKEREEKEFVISLIDEEDLKQTKLTGGTHLRKVWKARVVDEKAVPINFEHLQIRPINQSIINDLAKIYKGQIKIPGIEFYEDSTVAIRGGTKQ
ncbi:MAG: hypothetical protein ACLRVU_01080 [Beduini sp.]|uniref:hypothetical protein n=1 Tax=Beduini sp. TaxID=1922300 RepID=UPI00399FF3DB